MPSRLTVERRSAQSEKISFFQAIQASLRKLEPTDGSLSNVEIETAIRQVVDQALVSDTVINIFDEAGIKSPDLSIISDEFLAEVEGMEHQNLAVELLKKLLRDEIKAQRRTNIVQSRQLTEMLEDSLRRYQNQVISVTDVIQELINISKDVQAAKQRGEELGLQPYELAFYDALAQNRECAGRNGTRQTARIGDRPGGTGTQKCFYRLESQRKRPSQNEGDGQTSIERIRLST